MDRQIQAQSILGVLREQRNEALDRLAEMTAYAQELEEKLKKQVVPDIGGKKQ
jgi:hypothetical protein